MKNYNWKFLGNEKKYVDQVLINGFKASKDGTFSSKLEKLFSNIHNTKYAISMNSGTSALFSSMLAIGCETGDEVLVPALTPLMCGLAIHYTGATPIYVDSNKDNFLLDIEDLKKKITSKTKAILVVHMYGAMCDMSKIMQLAKKRKIIVIEDCAQCFLAKDNKNKISGTLSNIGVWSFESSKQITCGEGGIVTCNNKNLAKSIRKIGGLGFKNITAKSGMVRLDKNKFQNPDWDRFNEIGYNFRINQLGAAVALAQLERINFLINLRIKMASEYSKIIKSSNLLIPQLVNKNFKSTYYTYSTKFMGNEFGISWHQFRSQYIKFGGDGIYAAAKLLHQEPVFNKNKIGRCFLNCRKKICNNNCVSTPVSTYLQKRLMNFTTNQHNKKSRDVQINALKKTLKYFGDSIS